MANELLFARHDLVLCDTNVLSRVVGGDEKQLQVYANIGSQNVAVSSVTQLELYNWIQGYDTLPQGQKNKFRKFVADLQVFHLTREISKIAIDLAQQNKRLGVDAADFLIAATAVHYQLPLCTINVKHFSHLPDLLLYGKG